MKLNPHPKAVEEITELEPEHQQYILERLQELKEEPNSHEKVDVIQIQDRTVFKYVMKQEGRGGKDYRAVYDIENGRIRIFTVFHRNRGYNNRGYNNRGYNNRGYNKDKIARRF